MKLVQTGTRLLLQAEEPASRGAVKTWIAGEREQSTELQGIEQADVGHLSSGPEGGLEVTPADRRPEATFEVRLAHERMFAPWSSYMSKMPIAGHEEKSLE